MTSQKRNILVVGAGGMLAGHLLPHLETANYNLHLTDTWSGPFSAHRRDPFPTPQLRREYEVHSLDITRRSEVLEYMQHLHPDCVINCAAYTAVDQAEQDYTSAFAVNAAGVANLAQGCAAVSAKLLHISSDYVYGGTLHATRPYDEHVPFDPCGLYGQSKRYGDELAQALLPASQLLIVRTSWLHGLYGPNFVATIVKLARQQDELRIVNDQIGSPTWSGWLAPTIVELLIHGASGTFHAACRGATTWFDFAKFIVEVCGFQIRVVPQSSMQLARPAPRPSFSALDCTKLERFLNKDCIPWQQGVREHLKLLGFTV